MSMFLPKHPPPDTYFMSRFYRVYPGSSPRFQMLPHLVGEALQKDASCNCTKLSGRQQDFRRLFNEHATVSQGPIFTTIR
jgi:hypothetical protein